MAKSKRSASLPCDRMPQLIPFHQYALEHDGKRPPLPGNEPEYAGCRCFSRVYHDRHTAVA